MSEHNALLVPACMSLRASAMMQLWLLFLKIWPCQWWRVQKEKSGHTHVCLICHCLVTQTRYIAVTLQKQPPCWPCFHPRGDASHHLNQFHVTVTESLHPWTGVNEVHTSSVEKYECDPSPSCTGAGVLEPFGFHWLFWMSVRLNLHNLNESAFDFTTE